MFYTGGDVLRAIRSQTGMLVGMLDDKASTLQIKDGHKTWLIPVPPAGMTVTTVKGDSEPEQTHVSINSCGRREIRKHSGYGGICTGSTSQMQYASH